MMNIGEVARATGLSNKMIRHYEATGLIAQAQRGENGYRQYRETEVHTLRFIRQARSLGFPLEQIKQLLSLWQDRKRASADVKALVNTHIEELEQKIADLRAMRNLLLELARDCHGDGRPECPILEGLERDRPLRS